MAAIDNSPTYLAIKDRDLDKLAKVMSGTLEDEWFDIGQAVATAAEVDPANTTDHLRLFKSPRFPEWTAYCELRDGIQNLWGRTGTIQKPSISHGNYWPEKHGLTIVDTSHYKLEYRIQNDQEQILTHTTAIRKTSPGYQTLFVPMGRYKNLPPTCMCRQLAVGTVCSVGQGFGRPLYGVQEGYVLNFDVWDDG
ncbi:hypothetical protein BKA70DRAFT_1230960 [Coprinopsis sp. MPI-PUGE-AT-0042]|nr:hypothetical protein BKA70DRAFT_1230960 [Coprinopsis sp. MPI-PUGE-AT-0042]